MSLDIVVLFAMSPGAQNRSGRREIAREAFAEGRAMKFRLEDAFHALADYAYQFVAIGYSEASEFALFVARSQYLDAATVLACCACGATFPNGHRAPTAAIDAYVQSRRRLIALSNIPLRFAQASARLRLMDGAMPRYVSICNLDPRDAPDRRVFFVSSCYCV